MNFKVNLKAKYIRSLLAAVLLLTACDKSGSFSVISESSTFETKTTFVARKLDVLFVVDNSLSMESAQASLVQNFSSFIDRFITKGYDFKIAVTTTEAWRYPTYMALPGKCANDPDYGGSVLFCNESHTWFRKGASTPYVIDSNSSRYDLTTDAGKTLLKNDFIMNASMGTYNFTTNTSSGTDGSGDERALSSFQSALTYTTNLSDSLPSPNANFHRPDAYLAVVILSDEEDFSRLNNETKFNESYGAYPYTTWIDTSFTPALSPVSNYKTFLETFTSGKSTTDFSVSTISIVDQTCLDQLKPLSNSRKIGYRYMELADLTGGTKNSLCAPFDQSLDNISSTIAAGASAEFQLAKTPIVGSIRLIIDGSLIPQNDTNGWSYIAATKVVKINGSTYKPRNGAEVKLNFDPDLNNP